MKARGRGLVVAGDGRDIDLPFLNLSTRLEWMATPCPGHFTPGKEFSFPLFS